MRIHFCSYHFLAHNDSPDPSSWGPAFDTYCVSSTHLDGADLHISDATPVWVTERGTGARYTIPFIPALSLAILGLERDALDREVRAGRKPYTYRLEDPENPDGQLLRYESRPEEKWAEMQHRDAYRTWLSAHSKPDCKGRKVKGGRRGCGGHDMEGYLLAHPQLRDGFWCEGQGRWFTSKAMSNKMREETKRQKNQNAAAARARKRMASAAPEDSLGSDDDDWLSSSSSSPSSGASSVASSDDDTDDTPTADSRIFSFSGGAQVSPTPAPPKRRRDPTGGSPAKRVRFE